MTARFSRRWLLVAALLVGQLVCLLAGLVVFGSWLERGLGDIVRDRILGASRQIAGQFAQTLDLMGIDGTPLPADDWERLQNLVEETRLPNGGELVVVDADTGRVLAHPDLKNHPELGHTSFEEALLAGPADPAVEQQWLRMSDGAYVLAVRPLEGLDAYMLVIQPEEPLHDVVRDFVFRLRVIGVIVVVVLVAFSGGLSSLIIRGYENRLAAVNKGLEDLVERRGRALARSREGAIFGLAKLAESRDGETGEHLERISAYVELLAHELRRRHPELTPSWVHTLGAASTLHDIGKVGIPDAVLLKPGPLTDDERLVIQKHPAIGGETLREIGRRWGDDPFLKIASDVCFGHHERWDGGGYPFGQAGVQIPLAARIVALADVYDALTSRRAYKEPLSHDEARRAIVAESGQHFDPTVVEAFLAVEPQFRALSELAGQHTSASPHAEARRVPAVSAGF